MVFCPKCSAEYTSAFHVCSDCGVDLISDVPLEIPEEYEDSDWVELHTFPGSLYANMAVELLMREGIPSYSISDHGPGTAPGGNGYLSLSATVYVLEPELDQALDIIELMIEELPGSFEDDYLFNNDE